MVTYLPVTAGLISVYLGWWSGFGLLRTVYIALGTIGPPVVGQLADYGFFDGAFLLLGGLALATSL